MKSVVEVWRYRIHSYIVDHATSSAYVPPSVRAILAAGVAAAAGRGAHFLPISCGGV